VESLKMASTFVGQWPGQGYDVTNSSRGALPNKWRDGLRKRIERRGGRGGGQTFANCAEVWPCRSEDRRLHRPRQNQKPRWVRG
jgi:hypothetical protein